MKNTEKRSLTNASDIEQLIDTFYAKVLKDVDLSYFFTEAVKNWEFHKQQFVKYWSTQILFTENYEGSPLHRHVAIDQSFGKGFTKTHFDIWSKLWEASVDELFEGDKAEVAREAGINMAKNIYLKMFVNRPPVF